jgi:protein SCO1/2
LSHEVIGMKFRHILLVMLVLLVGATGFVAFNLLGGRGVELHGSLLEPSLPAADFTLASDGGPVRLADLRGKVVVLFFGYTFCPDVCPTTMVRLGRALELLGKDAERVQVVMISVDPERDTPERLGPYARAFHPSFLGLTGTREEIDAVASAYGIYHAKAEGSAATGYLVDHTANVLVLDRSGGLRLLWPFEVPAEALAADLRVISRK